VGSPYQLILLNLIHVQGFLVGVTRVLAALRRRELWHGAMVGWSQEQERQLRVLLVLFKQVGGRYGLVHRTMLRIAEVVGLASGLGLAALPTTVVRFFLKQTDDVLNSGLESAAHQIAIADWSGWEISPSINPPKALSDLAVSRREWPSKWEGLVQFL
jgi:hypothetical protein